MSEEQSKCLVIIVLSKKGKQDKFKKINPGTTEIPSFPTRSLEQSFFFFQKTPSDKFLQRPEVLLPH